MNPPSALSGAMGRERKPFTYTPGGINLSEIKSERMAQRLMRNAMNQGVPVTPAPSLKSPAPVSTPVVMPNYNCLPVQVFPAFALPANPKSLLRTRSNPDPNERLIQVEKISTDGIVHNNLTNNCTFAKKYDDNNPNNVSYKGSPNCNSDVCQFPLVQTKDENTFRYAEQNTSHDILEKDQRNYNKIRPIYFNISQEKTITKSDNDFENTTISVAKEECEKKEEENEQNMKNGDTNAAITIKLPPKKSEAKTEKKVEIVKNTLPDGSVQEVKTTTTTSTIDGRTEITTETETTTFPKDCGDDVEYEIVDEEEEEEEDLNEKEVICKNNSKTEKILTESTETSNLNGQKNEVLESEKEIPKTGEKLTTHHESHESSTIRKVTIQSEIQDSEEEEEEEEENNDKNKLNPVEVEEVVLLTETDNCTKAFDKPTEQEDEEKTDVINNKPEDSVINGHYDEEDNEEEYEEIEEEEEETIENTEEGEICKLEHEQNNEEVEEEYEEAEESEEIVDSKPLIDNEVSSETTSKEESNEKKEHQEQLNENQDICKDEISIPVQILNASNEDSEKEKKECQQHEEQTKVTENKIPLIEPTVPLDKVEEVEIKPIVPPKEIITKTHTEITTTTSDKPVGTTSTQTEYNVVQNVVTVNRTIKTLDHAYEEIPDNIPTIKTFVPPTLEGSFLTSQPAYRYQADFKPEPQTERRHSLLLERLSVERQMPAETYQTNYQSSNQTHEYNQYVEEPQCEILTVSNVKPSTISKNQQWYQRNEIENRSSTLQSTDYLNNNQTHDQFKPEIQSIYQPKPPQQPPAQTIYQPQIRVQPSPQPTYQPSIPVQNSSQPLYNQQSKPTYQAQPTTQRFQQTQPPNQSPAQHIYHPQPQYQKNTMDSTYQESYTTSSKKYEHSTYPSYTSKPVWAGQSFDAQPVSSTLSSQSSKVQKDSTDFFTQSNQQFSSSYVPPPWEQDPNYVAVNNSSSSFYQTLPAKTAFTTNTDWKSAKSSTKFSKSTPTSYIPPAPNQSFVKPVNTSEPPRQQGRKTYYSEYERRYISVPETTYIPNETKFQPQPDPSPQYYYDNNEPIEVVEPQWRKELREFKEQSSKTTLQTEETTVRPPWEDDPKYATPKEFTPTPTWTQTLKPRTWRERSFEPEYIGSQEWPKTNTLGRGRPQSSYVKNTFDRVPDRTRGVSVDRYNPNNYQSPLAREHPPPSSHVLDPIVQGKTYHNPSVPAYHSRASVEPREQPVTYQQPRHRESRAAPVQSRSFKYLQWITGTDD